MIVKIILFLLGIVCLMFQVTVQQREYVITLQSLENQFMDKKWGKITDEFKIGKFNQSATVMKGNFTIDKDLPEDAMCSMQSYQNMGGGKYGKGPIALPQTPCCKLLSEDDVIMPTLRNNSNFPEGCPITKGDYWMKKFNINNGKLPDKLPPPNDWMIQFNITENGGSDPGFMLEIFFFIDKEGPKG